MAIAANTISGRFSSQHQFKWKWRIVEIPIHKFLHTVHACVRTPRISMNTHVHKPAIKMGLLEQWSVECCLSKGK